MSDQARDYEVGYAKPPKSTRFKKGQSGNSKGRPKGAKGVRASLRRELESKITVREGGKEVRISKAEAMAKQFAACGLKGNTKVIMALLKLDAELFDGAGSDTDAVAQLGAPDPVDYDILRNFFSETAENEQDSEGGEFDDDNT